VASAGNHLGGCVGGVATQGVGLEGKRRGGREGGVGEWNERESDLTIEDKGKKRRRGKKMEEKRRTGRA